MRGSVTMEKQKFSKYERARIIGARGLQISMDAPLLIDIDEEELEGVNYDPLRIAEKELDSGVLPISVNRPMPMRSEDNIERIKIEDSVVSDAEKIRTEKEEERDISDGGEMMELADSGESSEIDEGVGEEKSGEDLE